MDFAQFAVLVAVIAGVTEFLHRLRAKDFWTAATIACAAVIGGVFGAVHYYPNLDLLHGVAVGFGAAGALTALGHIGNSSAATESTLTERNLR